MKTRMLIDLSETIRKGRPAPKGQEARYVRAGLAEVVTEAAPSAPAPAKKPARRKAKAKT